VTAARPKTAVQASTAAARPEHRPTDSDATHAEAEGRSVSICDSARPAIGGCRAQTWAASPEGGQPARPGPEPWGVRSRAGSRLQESVRSGLGPRPQPRRGQPGGRPRPRLGQSTARPTRTQRDRKCTPGIGSHELDHARARNAAARKATRQNVQADSRNTRAGPIVRPLEAGVKCNVFSNDKRYEARSSLATRASSKFVSSVHAAVFALVNYSFTVRHLLFVEYSLFLLLETRSSR